MVMMTMTRPWSLGGGWDGMMVGENGGCGCGYTFCWVLFVTVYMHNTLRYILRYIVMSLVWLYVCVWDRAMRRVIQIMRTHQFRMRCRCLLITHIVQ